MSSLPPLRALQVFETVGHYGSISRAAQHLGISVGAVSQHMKLLEGALHATLTVKEGQRIRLSAVGERLHARCKVAFEELRAATAEVERTKASVSLYVSSLPSILAKWLAPLMYDWNRNRTRVDIYWDTNLDNTSDREGVDFRISYGEGSGILENRAELFRDCVVPACPPAFIDGASTVVRPQVLADYPLIAIESKPKFDEPPSWADWFEDCGHEPEEAVSISLRCSSSSVAVQAAIDGQGIVLAQYSMIAADLKSGRLIIPFQHAVELSSPYFVSWPHNALSKPQCQDFQRWIIARGREQQRAIQEVLAQNRDYLSRA
ncbi:LysR family transcriptional regulator [Ensifer sp. ENS06]|uniref:LysR substrate-binding domain-containing protein n=1 Tax=Ensifer sp. ENS06 TaxID=2769276 RepID=UPI0017852EA1|nr:LysR substrate-binding domain-containing protein [Ensifer sp. ENS06]MBD9626956.1 LysR family transcriptional regulator [Ensifer sp. ENS06]